VLTAENENQHGADNHHNDRERDSKEFIPYIPFSRGQCYKGSDYPDRRINGTAEAKQNDRKDLDLILDR